MKRRSFLYAAAGAPSLLSMQAGARRQAAKRDIRSLRKTASHWIYESTGMARGDAIRGLIGWEYHGTPASIPGLEVVAEAPLFPQKGWDGTADVKSRNHPQRHAAVVFPCPKGNWVFNAGTIWWGEGLSQPPGHIPARGGITGTFGPDQRVQRITRNALDRFIRDSKRG